MVETQEFSTNQLKVEKIFPINRIQKGSQIVEYVGKFQFNKLDNIYYIIISTYDANIT